MTGPVGPSGLPEGLRRPGRCLVMGIVNVTPDSFSDGGRYADTDAAVQRGIDLMAAGADLVDVGGESTRPGAQRVPPGAEIDRVVPVVAALSGAGVPVSIDTMRAQTARRAVQAGAIMVNDVSGGLADAAMYSAVADLAVPYVVMHWRAHSQHMTRWASYGADVVGEVVSELDAAVRAARAAGIAPGRIVIDPGLGFAKEAQHNWAILAGMDRLTGLGHPVLIGASRKRFLGELLADAAGPRPVDRREDATAAISTLVAAAGAWCVRVHDVAATHDAVRVVASVAAARGS